MLGFTRLGDGRLGDGIIFDKHKGTSQNMKDAVIADTVDLEATMFVSQDNRSRNRLGKLSPKCISFTYEQFLEWLSRQ